MDETSSQEQSTMESSMPRALDSRKTGTQFNIMDTLLYILAGSSMAIISVSFLLWLRF
jgi:hypothetical protein